MKRFTLPSKIFTLKILFFVAVLLSVQISLAKTKQLNTYTITKSTIQGIKNCAHYKVTGACFWLVCHGICHYETTLKVDHYNPDAIVTVYNRYKKDPWIYANQIIDPAAYKLAKSEIKASMHNKIGDGRVSFSSFHHIGIHFKEVNVIGNPALWVMYWLPAIIPSEAISYQPYYSSLIDSVSWRSPLLEILLYPEKMIPGISEVGNLLHDWGSVFPRTGFVNQSADAKAAAVLAQRAADIATHSEQPHIYYYLHSGSCGKHCHVWAAKENDPKSIQWQMIYPKQNNKCMIFGTNDLKQITPWGNDLYQKGKGNYAWILWRHYKGCIPHKGKYVGSINF